MNRQVPFASNGFGPSRSELETLLRTILLALSLALAGATLTLTPVDADAQRLGRGKAAGMQRQVTPPKQADKQPDAPAQQQAQPPANTAAPATAGAAPAATGAAANAGKRSWLGPIAGIAAGLGIAALLSHLGLGGAFANVVTMLLLAVVAFVVVRWLLRRFAGGNAGSPRMQYAPAGASAGGPAPHHAPMLAPQASSMPLQRMNNGGAPTGTVPAGFDAKEFERIAKMIFIRLQAANDAGQVDDLRKFTTPELFASLRLDLQERSGAAQQTDVVQLDAQVVDTAQENDQWVASVRFSGLIRERADSGATAFDELWHLVKPTNGSREWAIAGITPVQ